MTRTAALDYARLVTTTWHILNATGERRMRLLSELPAEERAVVARGTSGPGFAMEQARRRKTVANVLNVTFPVTFFAYYGRAGADGLHAFLDSAAWQDRPAQPGSVFPPAATSSAAFAAFLHSSGWISDQEDWVGESFAFEENFLFGGEADTSGPDTDRIRLTPGAWVAEATFDVPEYGRLLRERGPVDPWAEALLLVKRRPAPLAVISLPEDGRVRRIHLRGDTVGALRWLWDDGASRPDDIQSDAYARAVAAGLVAGKHR